MKIFFKNMMTLLACLMFLVCSGCGIKAESDKNKVVYSVTDVTGTVIEFSEKPKRIVSMGIGSDEILLELVEPERIAALTYLADDAGISSVSVKAQVIKGRVQRNNLEAILSYAPDLVVVPDWDGIGFVGQLRSAGIKVYVHKTPNTMQEIKANIAELAAAVGEDEQGYLLQQQMDERLSAIWSKVGKIKPEQRKKIVALSFMGQWVSRVHLLMICAIMQILLMLLRILIFLEMLLFQKNRCFYWIQILFWCQAGITVAQKILVNFNVRL